MLPKPRFSARDKNVLVRTSLAVRWLGLCDFTANDAGSIPSQGTKITTSPHSAVRKTKQTKKRSL